MRIALILILAACRAPVGDPVVEAHRGGAGYWPQNSRAAVLGAIDAAFDGLHVDLQLTADEVPILWHEGGLDPAECTLAGGAPLPARRVIAEHTLEELGDVVCGGAPNPEHVNALVVAESLVTLDELLIALKAADARMVVHLDAAPARIRLADALARATLDRWFTADLPNPWYVSSPDMETIGAFEADARARGLEVPTSLVYPAANGASDPTLPLSSELRSAVGLDSYLASIEQAEADGITLHWEIAERQQLHMVRGEGYTVGLWTVNDPALLATYARWPVDFVLTDYPGDQP